MPSLFDSNPLPDVPFVGATYSVAADHERLMTQIECIRALVADERWRTIQKLTADLRKRFKSVSFPENSVQAQLRNLRKVGFRVERRNVAETGCLFEYRVLPPINSCADAAAQKEVFA